MDPTSKEFRKWFEIKIKKKQSLIDINVFYKTKNDPFVQGNWRKSRLFLGRNSARPEYWKSCSISCAKFAFTVERHHFRRCPVFGNPFRRISFYQETYPEASRYDFECRNELEINNSGSAKFLEPFIAPFGISIPTTTNVMEESVVCPKTKTSWQWSRNLKSQNPEYLGYPEYQWLELSERATYLSLYPKTFYFKKCLAQSYLTGRMSWLGLQKSMTSKGATRWTQRSGGQIERLVDETQRQIDASSPPLGEMISIGLQKNRETN